ncbi:MAG: hypothetical protein JXR03_21560 [Cyclobacteriaceae bacterium]
MKFRSKIKEKARSKLILTFSILLIISITSCEETNPLLDGQWNVMDVYCNGVDISGIDKSGISYIRNNMTFQDDLFFLPTNLSTEKTPLKKARFKQKKKAGLDMIEIYDSSDDRFNGLYLFEIKLVKEYNRGANKLYQLTLESDNIYVRGEKTVIKLF